MGNETRACEKKQQGPMAPNRIVEESRAAAGRPVPPPRTSLNRNGKSVQTAEESRPHPQSIVFSKNKASEECVLSSNSPVSSTSTIGDLCQVPSRPVPKIRNTLTPPLPRPLIPPPPPPPRPYLRHKKSMDNGVRQQNVDGQHDIEGRQNLERYQNLDAQQNSVCPSPEASSLDLNKLALRFADDDEAASRLKLRSQLRGSGSDDEDEDYRLSVLQTNYSAFMDSNETDDEMLCFCGWVTMYNLEKKKTKRNWASLRGDDLAFYFDDVRDLLNFECKSDNIYFVGLIDEKINIVCRPVSKRSPIVFSFIPDSNLEFWLLTLSKASCQNQKFVRNVISSSTAGGKIVLQQATTDEWHLGWAFIQNRVFKYYLPSLDSFFEVDLRRTIMVKKVNNRDAPPVAVSSSQVGSIQVSIPESSVRFQAMNDQATESWYDSLFSLFRNAKSLDDYPVTSDGVPVIVERCIEYVSLNGLHIKGLYRKNASSSACRTLLKDFKENPFTFKIMRMNDETANVAADVMRAFFRQLPEPLICTSVHNLLYKVKNDIDDPIQKNNAYRNVLSQLPSVNYKTLRRLLEHLVEVSKHSSENLASIENLAKVFAPTGFQVDGNGGGHAELQAFMSNIQVQIGVMMDLLINFAVIFPKTSQQVAADNRIEQIKNVVMPKATISSRLTSIVFNEKSFRVPSNYSVGHVLQYFCNELGIGDTSKTYGLFETHAEGRLRRRCRTDEVVEDVLVDKWNKLPAFVTDSLMITEIDGKKQDKKTIAFVSDVMFSEAGSKKFKQCSFKIESGVRVVCFSTRMKQHYRWELDDTIWFEGVDDRSPPTPHCLTFFCTRGPHEHKQKYKFLGFCLAFKSSDDLKLWLNCVRICQGEQD
ncbi:unnamed protein product [Bursaphelenchus okinawaensis]|uniref:Rho-GAP domain-containing protein n=1 Tax=Bursaphelenchus okinawaensis TaxID=465554 RepID=A0A811KI79_9BILA|nr:unnamed protein product [Bursaphelenchus okinawaensis]CAG9103499.1 unnamed protein product [Bursaphelenchus okinawaensis]